MSWQAGIRGPAFAGEPLGFLIRARPAGDEAAVDPAFGVLVEARLTEEAAGLLLAAAEWARVEYGPRLTGAQEGDTLESAHFELERALAEASDDDLVDVQLNTGQVMLLAGAAAFCSQVSGLDPFLSSEMVAASRSLQAAAAMGPVARALGLECRDRMMGAPFSLN